MYTRDRLKNGLCLVPALALATLLNLPGCGGDMPSPGGQVSLSYSCSAGKSFSVTISGRRARVMVDGLRYDLKWRKSSVGRKYTSGGVTFIEDEDRAVLTGIDAGPFRDCRRHESQPDASGLDLASA